MIELLKSNLKISSIYLRGYVKAISLKGKTHLGFSILAAYIKKAHLKDASDLADFIDIAAGRKEGDMILELMQLAKDYFLTTDETYWVKTKQRSVTRSLIRAGLIVHASDAMKLAAACGIVSDFVWQPYIEECLNTNNHEIAYKTLVALETCNVALKARVWNLLLRQIGKTSSIDEGWITQTLDYVVQTLPDLKIEEAVLTSVLVKVTSKSADLLETSVRLSTLPQADESFSDGLCGFILTH